VGRRNVVGAEIAKEGRGMVEGHRVIWVSVHGRLLVNGLSCTKENTTRESYKGGFQGEGWRFHNLLTQKPC
jgi:hypothetical protein